MAGTFVFIALNWPIVGTCWYLCINASQHCV